MKTTIQLLILSVLLGSCSGLFRKSYRKISPHRSGIRFVNVLNENDTLNYTIFPYMYMGGGVSTGDINNDGLPDIFFTGNMVPNKLYLNKGNMKFEDISVTAGIEGSHQWFTGSTMADVNNDGWLDIYVCVSAKYPPSANLLYINNQDNTFSEKSTEYGIGDLSSSVQATFFDYNNDGLPDLFVANYPIVKVTMGATYYYNKMKENRYDESGHLYRNNGDGSFSDVTMEAGVQNFGMSIGVVAMDFNNDGWKDLYLSNDFNGPDYFYLNKGDGTFREIVREATFQTSIFGMGFDAADVNNDGLIDMFQIDMTPEGHFRAMLNVAPMSRKTFDMSIGYGFHYQYMQNSLQVCNGIFDGLPSYSNISLFAGVAYTDWSWGGLFMDMDNDGNKDLFVTNGVLKDINQRDILSVSRNRIYFAEKKEYSPDLYPSTPVRNYVYRNNGDYTFSNMAESWGFDDLTLSNGAAFADFDNDGDLDIVISNVNDVSVVYENRVPGKNRHFLKIRLLGPATNRFGLGSKVTIQTGDVVQMQELTLTRGYQSSVPPVFHFGTGDHETIDTLLLTWPDGKIQVLTNIGSDQTLALDYTKAVHRKPVQGAPEQHFRDITMQSGIGFVHIEDDYDDYGVEMMLPHRNSRMGPGLAVGDVNSDGLEDFFVGNAAGSAGAMYVQTKSGRFRKMNGPWTADSLLEDTGALLFDADGDGKLDLYVVSGGNDVRKSPDYYRDRLYMNSDTGFYLSRASLPDGPDQSGKCVRSADYDGDGDLDLFVGGRIVPGHYPEPAPSYILENRGGKGTGLRFENNTGRIAPDLLESGLVTDAAWNDFDGDGDPDLIVVGEWMKICFFENRNGKFFDVSGEMGMDETVGWWYSIHVLDVDGDGDEDLLAGNLGLNCRYKASKEKPFDIYLNDFDVNGKKDIVMSYGEKGRNVPLKDLSASSRQIPVLTMRYETHEQFAAATIEEIYGEQMLESSLHYRVNTFANCWFEKMNNGKFTMHKLPNMAQFSSINDMARIEYGEEGPAFIVAGNLYYSEVETPRVDASVGLVLQTDEEGALIAIPPAESRLFVRGEVMAIGKIRLASGEQACLFAINNDSLRLIKQVNKP